MDPIFILICLYVILDMAFFLGGLLVETVTEKLKKCLGKFRDDRR